MFRTYSLSFFADTAMIVEREVHAFNSYCIKHRTSICAICTWRDLVMVVITGVEKAEVRFEQGERRYG